MQKTYALFDFDGTLIRGDSILLLCAYAYRKGLMSTGELAGGLWSAVRYGLRLLPAARAKESALHFLAGKTESEVDAIARDFCQTMLVPRLRPQGLETIARHHREGHVVLLISASSTFYLQHMQAALGVDDVIGTRFDVDKQGLFTGKICGDNCRGVQKPLRLAEYLAAKGDRLAYATSSAYGDTTGDLAMLNLCAHKVAVNPRRKLWRAMRGLEGATRVHWREASEPVPTPATTPEQTA